ncbi:MAG: hypothetical protein JXA91_05260 [Candidatus Thermoplasmatota archaeon]|nr:hypothetical protein [Candidatus Thermoplasmatota archaeon]
MFDFFEEKNSKAKKEKNVSDDREEKNRFHDRYINTQIQVDDFINRREQNKKSVGNKNPSKKVAESSHYAKRKIKLPNFRMGSAVTPSESICVEDELFEISLNNSSENKSYGEVNNYNHQFDKIVKKNGLNEYHNHSKNVKKSSWSFKKIFVRHTKPVDKCLKDIKKVNKNEKIIEKDDGRHQKFKFKIHTENPKIAETITLQQKTDSYDKTENEKSTIAENPKKWRKSKKEKFRENKEVGYTKLERNKKSEFQDESKPKKHGFFKPKNEKIVNSNPKSKEYDIDMHHLISNDRDTAKETLILDDEIKKLLNITDELLGKLPNEVIDEFAQSEDFKLYEKVMSKYKIK